jgi:hypothetical protein
MIIKTLLVAGIAALCLTMSAIAQVDTDAAKRRIVTFAAQIGRIDALAVACEIRDDGWADDLETEFALEATLPDVNKLSTEDSAAEARFANATLDRVKEIALTEFSRTGAPSICPGVKKDPTLARADKMVKTKNGPHDWSGAGGIK